MFRPPQPCQQAAGEARLDRGIGRDNDGGVGAFDNQRPGHAGPDCVSPQHGGLPPAAAVETHRARQLASHVAAAGRRGTTKNLRCRARFVRPQPQRHGLDGIAWRITIGFPIKPDEAFFVRLGLGETMTPQDILNGRMIVEIGMAPVRPAEFIILKVIQQMIIN